MQNNMENETEASVDTSSWVQGFGLRVKDRLLIH